MQWLPETLDDTLRVRHLPTGLDLQLAIEGRQVVLDDAALQLPQNQVVIANGPMAAAPAASSPSESPMPTPASATLGPPPQLNARIAENSPQIMLLSDGDLNSFALTIARDSEHRSVTLRSVSDGTVSASEIQQAQQ